MPGPSAGLPRDAPPGLGGAEGCRLKTPMLCQASGKPSPECFFIFQMMDAIKGTMTEIYNDLSKNTTGSTIAEVRVPCDFLSL